MHDDGEQQKERFHYRNKLRTGREIAIMRGREKRLQIVHFERNGKIALFSICRDCSI